MCVLAMAGSTRAWAAPLNEYTTIDLEDATTYSAKVYDFYNWAGSTDLATGSTQCGTAYEAGNAKYQKIYNCTAPEELVGVFAFQAITNDLKGKGTWLGGKGRGITNINATRSAAILNLKAGQVVVFYGATNTDFTGGGTNDGTWETSIDGDNIYITMKTDGNLGFCFAKGSYTKSITIYSAKIAGVCESPTLSITGASGTARIFSLACETADAEIYYSETEKTVSDDGWTKYTSAVTTDAATIYSYAKNNDATSEVVPFSTGAGTVITLNAPVVSITKFLENGNVYNPVYTFSSDQSTIIGKPVVTYSYTINGTLGESSSTSYQATTTGDLVVTASAKGYEDASTTVNIQNCNFAKAFNYDFSTFTEHSGTAVGTLTNVNGKGCQAYQIDADAVDGITINMNLLWAITNNNAVGLYARTGKGSITYKGDFPAGSYAIFSNYGSPVVSSSATTEFLMYGLALDMAVYTPTASISLPYTYTTFSSTAALDFTDNNDVEAYMAQVNGDGTAVTLKQVYQVPAGTGVVLKKISDAETTTVKVLESAADLAGNQLVGVTEDNKVSAQELITAGNAYVLVEEQFCKVVEGATGYIPAGKAYLSVPVRNAAKAMRLDFNGTPTEAVSVAEKAEKAQDAIYNVQGIRVQKPTVPGLYIVNGKTYRF